MTRKGCATTRSEDYAGTPRRQFLASAAGFIGTLLSLESAWAVADVMGDAREVPENAPPRNPDAVGYSEHRLTVGDGLSMYYRVYPGPAKSATPVLCLPGYRRNSRDFEELATHLATTRLVVTPDLRGRGLSDHAPTIDQYAFPLLVSDMWALLDELRLARCIVIGTTLGGLMALEMARQHPDRIAAIVLNEAGPERPVEWIKKHGGRADFAPRSLSDTVEHVRSENASEYPEFGPADWVRMTLRAYRKTPDGQYQRDFDPNVDQATAKFWAEHPSRWEELRAVSRTPIQLIRGDRSDFLTEEVAARMTREHPQIRLAVIKDRGHFPLLNEPQALNAIDRTIANADGAR